MIIEEPIAEANGRNRYFKTMRKMMVDIGGGTVVETLERLDKLN